MISAIREGYKKAFSSFVETAGANYFAVDIFAALQIAKVHIENAAIDRTR